MNELERVTNWMMASATSVTTKGARGLVASESTAGRLAIAPDDPLLLGDGDLQVYHNGHWRGGLLTGYMHEGNLGLSALVQLRETDELHAEGVYVTKGSLVRREPMSLKAKALVDAVSTAAKPGTRIRFKALY